MKQNKTRYACTWGFPGGLHGKEFACNDGDPGSLPGLGRCPGEGNGNPVQYSCLENPTDREIWRATVHGVAKSWTQLNNLTHTHTGGLEKRTESLGSCLPENKAPEASRPLPPCPREGIGLAKKLIWVF